MTDLNLLLQNAKATLDTSVDESLGRVLLGISTINENTSLPSQAKVTLFGHLEDVLNHGVAAVYDPTAVSKLLSGERLSLNGSTQGSTEKTAPQALTSGSTTSPDSDDPAVARIKDVAGRYHGDLPALADFLDQTLGRLKSGMSEDEYKNVIAAWGYLAANPDLVLPGGRLKLEDEKIALQRQLSDANNARRQAEKERDDARNASGGTANPNLARLQTENTTLKADKTALQQERDRLDQRARDLEQQLQAAQTTDDKATLANIKAAVKDPGKFSLGNNPTIDFSKLNDNAKVALGYKPGANPAHP